MIPGIGKIEFGRLKEEFSQHPEIESVILFGSRALNNFRHGSDIDLAVVFRQPVSFNYWLGLLSKMDELNLAQKIDLVDFRKIINPDLKNHILRAGITVYQS